MLIGQIEDFGLPDDLGTAHSLRGLSTADMSPGVRCESKIVTTLSTDTYVLLIRRDYIDFCCHRRVAD
jgi:hypothetical protein